MKEFVVQENPSIRIVLFNDRFEIHQPDTQIYEYILTKIDSLHIGKRVNWFVSVFSFVVGFFIGGSGEVYKERDQLMFNYEGESVLISLEGGDKYRK